MKKSSTLEARKNGNITATKIKNTNTPTTTRLQSITSVYDYINQRYPRWLDYAIYHAELAHLHGQGPDLLQTVLESLLKKDPGLLEDLLSRKKNGYTELDFFVLRMIKLNATSDYAPYRHKNRSLPKDENADPWGLDIIDEGPEECADIPEQILSRYQEAREILSQLNIPDREKEIFFWKFFGDNTLRSWPGDEPYSTLCTIQKKVKSLVYSALAPDQNGVIALPEHSPSSEKVMKLAVRILKAGMSIQNERNRILAVRLVKASIHLRRAA